MGAPGMKMDHKLSETVVHTVREPLLVLDESLRVSMANRSYYETFRARPELTEGRAVFDLDDGRWDIPDLRHRLEEVLRHNREIGDFEVERDIPQIGRRAILLNARPFRHGDGLSGRILLALHDVTDHKRTEAALRASELRFAALMDNTPAVAFMRDECGKYVYVNRAFELVTGKAPAEVVGRTAFDVWPAEIAASLLDHDRLVLAKDEPMEIMERTASADGTVREWLSVKFPFCDEEGRRMVGCVSLDMTDRRKLEEQLRKAQKMEAIGRLAGGLAHDFNNLLTIIDGYAQLMLEDSSPTPSQQVQLHEILKAGERAAELTRQLLAFSRQQPLAPVILDMNGVVRGVEKMLNRLIGENIDLRTVLDEDLYVVKADPAQMEQVLLNLAVNARDAMPEGGALTIETSNVELDDLYSLAHPLVAPGDYVLIAVTDTGTGMDRETQAHVFEPFFTTKEPGKGTGLGLATVYGIVKQSGGFIWLYSEPSCGSTFKIYLPRAEGEAGPRPVRPARAEVRSGTETILLVEDDRGVRELASQVLQSRGYKLLVASDPEEAVKVFGQHSDSIQLLLTDVVMPKASGRELAGRLLELRPDLKVLYMSGYTEGSVVHRGVIDRGALLLQKPFSPEQLLRTVRSTLDR